jgi:phosphatidylglycerol---prolipoprotein diacylglyceryl transferase
MDVASIPSPSQGVWHIGDLPIRAYALCIIIGIIAAILITDRRWVARGGRHGTAGDVAVWAVPFGIVGGRLYHVITSPELYFDPGRRPIEALYIWRGGLGIWGAIALGGVGAWIACRRRGIPLPAFADAAGPGIAVAQAIGRLGNWFNQELFGRPTDLPWGLEIDEAHRPVSTPEIGLYHPTFLYELLWLLGVAAVVVWADKRFQLGHGRAFALYVAGYTLGRFWIESLRVDPAHEIFGLRINEIVSALVFLGAVVYFIVSARLRPGREEIVDPRQPTPPTPSDDDAALAEDDPAAGEGAPADRASADATPTGEDAVPDRAPADEVRTGQDAVPDGVGADPQARP